MGLVNKTQQESSPTKMGEDLALQKHEIEFLLSLVKNSTFKGEHVEIVYNTVYKLQQQYTNR